MTLEQKSTDGNMQELGQWTHLETEEVCSEEKSEEILSSTESIEYVSCESETEEPSSVIVNLTSSKLRAATKIYGEGNQVFQNCHINVSLVHDEEKCVQRKQRESVIHWTNLNQSHPFISTKWCSSNSERVTNSKKCDDNSLTHLIRKIYSKSERMQTALCEQLAMWGQSLPRCHPGSKERCTKLNHDKSPEYFASNLESVRESELCRGESLSDVISSINSELEGIQNSLPREHTGTMKRMNRSLPVISSKWLLFDYESISDSKECDCNSLANLIRALYSKSEKIQAAHSKQLVICKNHLIGMEQEIKKLRSENENLKRRIKQLKHTNAFEGLFGFQDGSD